MYYRGAHDATSLRDLWFLGGDEIGQSELLLCKPYILQSLCSAALHDDECSGTQSFRPILDISRNANSKIISTLPSLYGVTEGSVARKRLACWKYEADVSLSLNPSVCTL